MNIFQSGIPRSGNGWLYNIVYHSLRAGNVEVKNYIKTQPIHQVAQSWPEPLPGQASTDTVHFRGSDVDYGIGQIFRYPIPDWQDYLRQATQLWCHEPYRRPMREKLSQVSHLIYIIRDPRDASISHSRFVFADHIRWFSRNKTADPATFLKKLLFFQVRRWAEHVGSWLQAAQDPTLNIHFIFYERLLHDFENELDQLVSFLGLDLSTSQRQRVREATTFASMKAKYPNHVRRGIDREWVEVLTPLQKSESAAMVPKMLKLLNYPVQEPPMSDTTLPGLPTNLSKKDIQQAVRDAQSLTWREIAARVKQGGLRLTRL